MAEIEVTRAAGNAYRVVVAEAGSQTTHTVTATPADVERFAPGVPAADLVAASFRFLLDREPKESILGEFDLPVVARYFPEYPERIAGYL